jgi:cytochrome c556
MQAKLKAAQKLLEGLAVSDFQAIAASGEELTKISKAAEFLNALKTDDYRLQMAVFQRSAEAVSKRAKEQNLDGATLAYVDMTMTCVKCHQTTRDRPDARRPREGTGTATR